MQLSPEMIKAYLTSKQCLTPIMEEVDEDRSTCSFVSGSIESFLTCSEMSDRAKFADEMSDSTSCCSDATEVSRDSSHRRHHHKIRDSDPLHALESLKYMKSSSLESLQSLGITKSPSPKKQPTTPVTPLTPTEFFPDLNQDINSIVCNENNEGKNVTKSNQDVEINTIPLMLKMKMKNNQKTQQKQDQMLT